MAEATAKQLPTWSNTLSISTVETPTGLSRLEPVLVQCKDQSLERFHNCFSRLLAYALIVMQIGCQTCLLARTQMYSKQFLCTLESQMVASRSQGQPQLKTPLGGTTTVLMARFQRLPRSGVIWCDRTTPATLGNAQGCKCECPLRPYI